MCEHRKSIMNAGTGFRKHCIVCCVFDSNDDTAAAATQNNKQQQRSTKTRRKLQTFHSGSLILAISSYGTRTENMTEYKHCPFVATI